MIIQKRLRKQNRRASTSKQRKRQHLLDVKIRAKNVAARRTQSVLLSVCGFILIAAVLGGIAFGAKRILNALFFANADYTVKTIEVTSDGNLTREAILRATDVAEGRNIFSISLPKVQEELASLPQVEEIVLHLAYYVGWPQTSPIQQGADAALATYAAEQEKSREERQ